MKSVLQFFFRGFISTNVTVVSWLIAFFGFNESFALSSLWAILGGVGTYSILKISQKQKLLKQNQLTRKEYQYIQGNLKEAQAKIQRMNKSLLGIRSVQAIKQIGTQQRLVSRIYSIVKKEPKRFYQAERFFFYHLDSVVELSEKYIFLTRQNMKEQDVQKSLFETEATLKKLIKSLEDDLMIVLSDDIDQLNLELDVAKQSIKRNENNVFPKEGRN